MSEPISKETCATVLTQLESNCAGWLEEYESHHLAPLFLPQRVPVSVLGLAQFLQSTPCAYYRCLWCQHTAISAPRRLKVQLDGQAVCHWNPLQGAFEAIRAQHFKPPHLYLASTPLSIEELTHWIKQVIKCGSS